MNRQIKFKAKILNSDQWICGYYYYNTPTREHRIISPVEKSDEMLGWNIDPSTIGQFTGLKDKNGTEIYEGDILRFPPKDEWERTSFVGYEVFWHDNDCCERHIGFQMNRHHFYGYVCGTCDFRDFKPKTTKQMIVIGNIHDKKEEE
ncbi:MAG: YopX family protein [Lachnospiraceae bacterium]|nr:YopX family protein [Lachnospiraceae bacterium]